VRGRGGGVGEGEVWERGRGGRGGGVGEGEGWESERGGKERGEANNNVEENVEEI